MGNSLNVEISGSATGSTISPRLLGGEYLGWTGFPGWKTQAEDIGISHMRWPGGIVAEDRMEADGYAYDLSEPNVTDNWPLWNGNPRPGLSEMFEYSVQENLSFSMIIPTARYVEAMFVDEAAALEWLRQDLNDFTTRLFNGEFGDVPAEFSLEIGAEYYSTDFWEANAFDPRTIEYFSQVFAEAVAVLDQAEQTYGANLYNVFVQTGRFQSNDDTQTVRNGESDDSLVFLQAYEDRGVLDAIDGVIWHRYVYTFDQINDHLSLDGGGNEETLLEHLALWESAIGTPLQTMVSWAAPDIDSTGASESSNFFDYGPRSALDTLQMFSYLSANGVDIATIYGIDSPWTGAISSGGTTPEDFQVLFNGEVYSWLTESVIGLTVLDGFLSNQIFVDSENNPIPKDHINANVFSDETSNTVAFLSAWDLESVSVGASIQLPDSHSTDFVRVSQIRPSSDEFDAVGLRVLPEVSVSMEGVEIGKIQDFDVLRAEFLNRPLTEDDLFEYGSIGAISTGRVVSTLSVEDDTHELIDENEDLLVLASEGNDTLTGSAFVDHIIGGAGSDQVHGNSGNDLILGDGVSFSDVEDWLDDDFLF